MEPSHTSSAPGDSRAAAEESRVQVLLPLPLRGAYDYRVPAGMSLNRGDFVRVPLGARMTNGVVWDEGGGAVSEDKLKDVAAVLAAPRLPPVMRRFVDWVAGYTLSAPGAVLRMAVSVPEALEPPVPLRAYRLVENERPEGVRITAARERVLTVLGESGAHTAPELARLAGVGTSVVRGLAAAGLIEEVLLPAELPPARPDPGRPGPALTANQAAAAEALRASLDAAVFSVSLLDGVTGSGKTEVYFEAVAAALARNQQALVLLPEIAMSAQWFTRFRERFAAAPVEWHSDLTRSQRRRAWRAVARGEARVVVGARSALFLPFPELGLIVVDEEHDSSFKQEDGVIYQARDMAVVRAHLGAFPIVLASATPSLESLVNVERGRYRHLRLPQRHGGAALPDVRTVDMRSDPPPRGAWLSPVLRAALAETVAVGEQAMLFLNRRGYAPLTLCRRCGHRLQCPHCTAWLVDHRLARRLECHHCGFSRATPDVCPECDGEGSLAACGPGIERLAEEVATQFPDIRTAVAASDTLYGPGAAAELVRRVQARELDLLIGTQVIAKGHHFPALTLVGVVDADLGLAGGDLRAGERTFQLLAQVTGRAGRAARAGRALLQTYMPEHPVMRALTAMDRDAFLAEESRVREARGLPPFGRLAALIVSGRNPQHVDNTAAALGRAAPRKNGIDVLGPAPAPLATLRGHHRRRLLLKARRGVNVQAVLRRWLGAVSWPSGVRVKVDVDPYSFV